MEKHYWNEFYLNNNGQVFAPPPSQFATFVASEFQKLAPFIVDIGCGNGRDTKFFAGCGFPTLGVDSSSTAINACQQATKGFQNLNFLCAKLGDSDIHDTVHELSAGRPLLIYGRFFLHAISDLDETKFFELAKAMCGATGVIAVEFRTEKDEFLPKLAKPHFRRYMNPVAFIERAARYGFSASYFVEGFGFAKFMAEDPHVSRVLLFRSPNY